MESPPTENETASERAPRNAFTPDSEHMASPRAMECGRMATESTVECTAEVVDDPTRRTHHAHEPANSETGSDPPANVRHTTKRSDPEAILHRPQNYVYPTRQGLVRAICRSIENHGRFSDPKTVEALQEVADKARAADRRRIRVPVRGNSRNKRLLA